MQNFGAEKKDFAGLRVDAFGWGYRMFARPGANGFASVMRGVQAVFGVAALAAALSLWLAPGANYGLDVAAMKGAVTIALLILATILWRGSREVGGREVHIDMNDREVRIVVRRGNERRIARKYAFADLGAMNIVDHALHLYTDEGDRLAVVDLDPSEESLLAA